MNFVHAPNNVVATYPYSYHKLREDNPNVSFPEQMGDWLASYNVFPVTPTARPEPIITKNVVEGTPILVNGVWTQVWNLVDASAEEVARRTEKAAQQDELSAAQLDAWITAYLGMTPAQAQTYIENNSATLAALRTNVARLAYAVRVLIRREFNR